MTSTNDPAPGSAPAPGASPSPDLGALLQGMLGEARPALEAESVEGVAGGGAVRVTMAGDGAISAVRFRPDAVDPGDLGLLEDLVVSACADAHRQVRSLKLRAASRLAEAFGLGELAR